MLCAGPWTIEPAYDARDMRSEAAANDWRDCLSSAKGSQVGGGLAILSAINDQLADWCLDRLPGRELTRLLGKADPR